MKNAHPTPIKKHYGSFTLAVLAYVAGVVLFTGWNYFSNRAALIGHNDALLTDAAFATRELLEFDPAKNRTLADVPERKREKLSRLARNCDFSIIGAAERIGGETRAFAVGPNPTNSTPPDAMNVGELALDLAGSTGDGVATLTLDHEELGHMRAAVLFMSEGNGNGVAYMVALESARVEGQLREQAIRSAAAAVFLMLMVFPMMVLFARTRKRSEAELTTMNNQLLHDVDTRKRREEELRDAIADLERFSSVTTGRESRIIELKAEVNVLLEESGRSKRYNVDKTD